MRETMPAAAGRGGATVAGAPQKGCAPLAEHIEAALAGPMTGDALDEIARAIWGARGAGELTDEDAARLDSLVRTRRAAIQAGGTGGRPRGAAPVRVPRVRRSRSPDRQASIERRRRVAASGAVPPELAAQFTQGQVAVLSVVGREAARGRPVCDWPMDKVAALAGVCRTVVRDALRLAQILGLVRVQERRWRSARSDTNVVTITAKGWWRWLKRIASKIAETAHPGGGRRNPKATYTKELKRGDEMPVLLEPATNSPNGSDNPDVVPQARQSTLRRRWTQRTARPSSAPSTG